MVLSKKEFINTLKFIKDRRNKEERFISALESLSPSTYCDCFIYNEYEEKLINLLEVMFEDDNHDISYFIYDLDGLNKLNKKHCPKYGNNKYLYTSIETLYDYLVKEMKHEKI